MLILIARYRLPPNGIGSLVAAMADMIAATRAEEGCLEYSYSLDVLEADLLRMTEVWIDRAALERHFASAHMAVWAKARTDLGLTDRRVVIYDHAGAPEEIL